MIGYLHTGFEKTMEQKTWWKCMTYPERIDYVSYQYNGLAFVLAVEKLLEIEIPRKATWMRMCLGELNRLHSHLIWLGTSALEIGAISMLWYAFREREEIVLLTEMVGGTRMHTRYFQAGGLAEDIPPGFYDVARKFCEQMINGDRRLRDDPRRRTRSGSSGRSASGCCRPTTRSRSGSPAPSLRASGVDWDLRRDMPYLAYDEVDFDVPVYPGGDVYDRYKVHMDEMRQSVRIIRQCLDRLESMEGEPWIADDRKVVLPPRHELHTSMESLIHHFKIVTEGYTVPEGEIYLTVESPRGELGCYLVSDGGPKPWRVKFRAPSFVALEATATCMTDAAVADLIAIVGSLDGVMGEVDR